MEADRQTYVLGQRFSMPIENGTRDAIAVSFDTGKKILSAYTLMVNLIVLQIWTLIVLAAISMFMRKAHSPNIGAASAAIWNSQTSAFSVLTLMAKYFLQLKRKRDRLYVLSWIFAAAGFIALAYAISIWVPRFLILGNGAPVEPESIFVPMNYNDSYQSLFESNSLLTPSSLRAAGSVNATTLQKVNMSKSVVTSSVNGTVKRIGYDYTITGAEFGLQHAPDLRLTVEGSCVTEYSWLVDTIVLNDTVIVDNYSIFAGDPSTVQFRTLSLFDGRAPTGFFHTGSRQSQSNTTFAIAVSSIGRFSFTEGSDPLYATDASEEFAPYQVMPQRPILSCWQNDIWFNKDNKGATSELSSLPGLNMPENFTSLFFERFLGVPVIATMGPRLGNRAIQSSVTSVEQVFDAGASSMETDLHYLVAAAYIASTRILGDTTTISSNSTNLPNIALDPATGKLYPGVADFIINSSNIATLSVKVLIIIPVVLVFLFLLVIILTNTPASWNKAQALRATILYSCLDQKTNDGGRRWNRSSEIAHHISTDEESRANLKPEFSKNEGLYWVLQGHEV